MRGRFRPALALRRLLVTRASQPLTLRADSEAEAVAFAAAVIGRAPRLTGSALVVETAEGWRFVEQNPQLRIALCASSALAERAPPRDGLLVLVPHAAGDPHASGQETSRGHVPILVVPRPSAWAMERALVRLGLDEARAERLTRQSGRSWSVFRRLNANRVPAWRPAWLAEPERRAIPLLALVDTFTDREGDREVVEHIAGWPFEAIERELRTLVASDDAPLLEIGPRFGPNRTFKAKSPLELLHLAGDRITSAEFDRFLGEAVRVLGEPDPALELPPNERWAANVRGKSRRFSDELLRALATALPRLAVRGPETGLSRLDVTVRIEQLVGGLLAKADRTRWLSLAPYLPDLAEAAPDIFLEAVEESLDAPDRPIAALFAESGSADVGRHYYACLLWALERLAWSPLRLRRVCEVLGALSALPRPENLANSPRRSLKNIFCPWLPQTDASVDQRLAVLDAWSASHPDIVFDLYSGMLPPVHHAVMFPNRRPEWRDEGLRAQRVTIAEYRRAVEAAADRAIASAVGHPERLARLVEDLDAVREAGREDALLAALARFAKQSLPDDARIPVWHALRERLFFDELRWQRPFPWRPSALPLTRIHRSLAPRDLVARYSWLFDAIFPDLPGAPTTHEARDRITWRQRIRAVRAIVQHEGIGGLFRLAEASPEILDLVGKAATRAGIDPRELVREAIARGVFSSDEDTPTAVTVRCAVYDAPIEARRPALELLIGHLAASGRPAREFARLLLPCLGEPALRDLVDAQPDEVRHELRMLRPTCDADIRALLDAGQPVRALKFLSPPNSTWSSVLLLETLEKLASVGPDQHGTLLGYNVEEAVERLEKDPIIDRSRLAQLEYALFPLLRSGFGAFVGALFDAVTSDPHFFVKLLTFAYRAEGEPRQELDERATLLAKYALNVLEAVDRAPGRRPDGTIDEKALRVFVDRTRKLAGKAGRLRVCEVHLGRILAHAPEDPDGAWPCRAVASVLDRRELERVREGFPIGVYRKRGVVTRRADEGGDQERALAARYRGLAHRHAVDFPRVAAMLERIAEAYDHDAARADEDRRGRLEGLW